MRLLPAAALLGPLSIAACVAPPVAPPVEAPPPPVAVMPPAPLPRPAPLARDWQDWPVTAGTWRYAREAGATRAVFAPRNGAAVLSLRCDLAARRVILSRPGGFPGAMTIRTSSTTRAVPVQVAAGASEAVFAAREPLLDAMAFSRGRVAIEQRGAPTLVVPPFAEIGRVIEDCRG